MGREAEGQTAVTDVGTALGVDRIRLASAPSKVPAATPARLRSSAAAVIAPLGRSFQFFAGALGWERPASCGRPGSTGRPALSPMPWPAYSGTCC